MPLTQPVDTHDFLRSGFFRSALPRPVADMLLRNLERLTYSDMPSDHCDAGPRYRGNIEHDDRVRSVLKTFWKQMVKSDLAPLSKLFHSPAEESVINVIRLGDGYWLDWHNHLAARPAATVLIYLFTDGDPGDGGDLVLGELGPDLTQIQPTERLEISHGDVVLIGDMTHPLLQHKAERWHGKGWRYLISFAFCAADW